MTAYENIVSLKRGEDKEKPEGLNKGHEYITDNTKKEGDKHK